MNEQTGGSGRELDRRRLLAGAGLAAAAAVGVGALGGSAAAGASASLYTPALLEIDEFGVATPVDLGTGATTYGVYSIVDDWCLWEFWITYGTDPDLPNTYWLQLPVDVDQAQLHICGTAGIVQGNPYDATAAYGPANVTGGDFSTPFGMPVQHDIAAMSLFGVPPESVGGDRPFTPVANDFISGSGHYLIEVTP